MEDSLNNREESLDSMYPHSGSFVLSNEESVYPGSNENIYLLMRGFNGIKINGSISNARITLIWNLVRDYSTELWSYEENIINDTLVFPFKDNSGTITFEGRAEKENVPWEAKLSFQFVNLTQNEISILNNSEGS